ncbi:MAG TPA: F0F1 ATP synthase subunit A [Acidimicrobiales bacterium]|nr:F0F1 ATP synthase subunit A [Acidimicrobiales bacterium]
MIFGLEFPPLSHVVNWPEFIGDDTWGINKVVLIYFLAALFTMLIFILGNKKQLVPTGAQNLAEVAVEFVEDGIVMDTIGPKGVKYTPLLISFFFFIFFCNIFEIIPGVQMPATARIALPMFLAVFIWFVFNIAGMVEHGPIGYLKHSLIPPGVPAGLLPIIVPIEFVSNFLVRPFSLMVRLFANLLAGHILLVTFAVLTAALWTQKWYAVFLPLPLFAVIFFTAFEILVSFLQAYVFTLLAAVYIDSATSHEH